MDPTRFDALARSLAAPRSRRGLLGSFAALGAGVLGARAAGAQQVTQAYCGNVVCRGDGCACRAGCVCCVYGNGNSRCRPPGECGSGTAVACPPPTTTTTPTPTTTTAEPTSTTTPAPTTTTTTTAPPLCGGVRCPVNETCVNGACKCRNLSGGSIAPTTCCPEGNAAGTICHGSSSPSYVVVDTCVVVSACPAGYTTCAGSSCRACCPPGTTCEPAGFCRQ